MPKARKDLWTISLNKKIEQSLFMPVLSFTGKTIINWYYAPRFLSRLYKRTKYHVLMQILWKKWKKWVCYRMIEVIRPIPAPIVVCVLSGREVECVTSVINQSHYKIISPYTIKTTTYDDLWCVHWIVSLQVTQLSINLLI